MRRSQRPAHQPFAPGPRKENKRQKAIEQNDDEDEAQRGLENFVDAPGAVAEHREAHQHGDGSRYDLGQHRHGERGARPAYSQPGLNSLLEGGNVFLELPRKEFADLGVDAVHVGDQGQQAEHQQQRSCDGVVHRVRASVWRGRPLGPRPLALGPKVPFVGLTFPPFLSIKPSAAPEDARNFASLPAIAPWSHS